VEQPSAQHSFSPVTPAEYLPHGPAINQDEADLIATIVPDDTLCLVVWWHEKSTGWQPKLQAVKSACSRLVMAATPALLFVDR